MHTIRAHLRRTPATVAGGVRRLSARARCLGKEAGQTSVEYMGIIVVAALLVFALITSPLSSMVTGLATNAINAIQSQSPSGGGGSGKGGDSGKGNGSDSGKNAGGKPNQKPQ